MPNEIESFTKCCKLVSHGHVLVEYLVLLNPYQIQVWESEKSKEKYGVRISRSEGAHRHKQTYLEQMIC